MADATTYSSKLEGTRVLIVGATSGIGFAVANAVLELGASTIILSSSSTAKLDTAIARLQKSYPVKSQRAHLLRHAANLKDSKNLEKTIEDLLDFSTSNKTSKLDHVIYTAGDPLAVGLKPEDMTLKMAQDAGMVRFFAPLILGSRIGPHINASPKSSITLTSGVIGHKPMPAWSLTASYSTALAGLMRGLSQDLRPVRVNVVAPGPVRTELWDGLSPEVREATMEYSAKGMLTGRVPGPEDVVEAYLLSVKDTNCAATVIDSNGGMLLT